MVILFNVRRNLSQKEAEPWGVDNEFWDKQTTIRLINAKNNLEIFYDIWEV